MKRKNEYSKTVNITAVERALKIMETIYHEHRELGVNEIAAKMGEHQSTIYRAAMTLVYTGYLYQNEETGKYGLGFKNYILGRSVERDSSLLRIAKPYAEAIATEFGETVNVAIRDTSQTDDYCAITIYQARGNNRTLSITESIGIPYECYSCSVGKALLAFSEDLDFSRLRKKELKKYTDYTIIDNDKFEEELLDIRKKGFALDNQERELGLFCISCPVLDGDGVAKLAMSVSGYDNSIKGHGVDNIVTSLKRACAEMSNLII